MKFSHIADCHIGAWRDERLKDLNSDAFSKAIDISIKEKVDFILISGDLFNTAIPGIDKLKEVARILKDLQERGMPVYLIAGSHDFSPSGRTMLDVLEEAGLCINVTRGKVHEGKLRLEFTIDEKTGAKITGILGRRGMLDRSYYEELDFAHLEKETGFKIFMFHTSISELKPESMANMESAPLSLLPKGFNYYAGGHVHIIENRNFPGYKNVVYPGPMFPNNFYELEELKEGGFFIYDEGRIVRHDVRVKEVICVNIDATGKSTGNVTNEIITSLDRDVTDAIILIRLSGHLAEGKSTDVNFSEIYERLYERKAYFIMRNTTKLTSAEYEEIKVEPSSSEEIEDRLLKEHAGQLKIYPIEKEISLVKDLMNVLSSDKKDGEKVYEFETRMLSELDKLLGI